MIIPVLCFIIAIIALCAGFFYGLSLMTDRLTEEKAALDTQIDWCYDNLSKVNKKKFDEKFYPRMEEMIGKPTSWNYNVRSEYEISKDSSKTIVRL